MIAKFEGSAIVYYKLDVLKDSTGERNKLKKEKEKFQRKKKQNKN